MDLKQYVQDAIRTESVIDKVETDPLLLQSMLQVFIASGCVLDMIKKNVFYGKPISKDDLRDHFKTIVQNAASQFATMEAAEKNDEDAIKSFDVDINPRVFHSLVGILTESSELAEALLEILVTGNADNVNILEEFGDIGWYEAIGIDELDGDFQTILETNIEKLRKRFPEKFTSEEAINRDLETERNTLEDGLSNA